jgi:hypothetical protein
MITETTTGITKAKEKEMTTIKAGAKAGEKESINLRIVI